MQVDLIVKPYSVLICQIFDIDNAGSVVRDVECTSKIPVDVSPTMI